MSQLAYEIKKKELEIPKIEVQVPKPRWSWLWIWLRIFERPSIWIKESPELPPRKIERLPVERSMYGRFG